MQVNILKGKIHRARITDCVLYYEGSLGVDLDLLDASGILPYERILVVNAYNGARLETYAIPEERGSRTICLNGAAARRGAVGDELTIMAFAACTPEEVASLERKVIVLNADNEIIEQRP